MTSAQDQLDALRELLWLYSQARLWGAPRRFAYEGVAAKRYEKELQKIKRDLAHTQLNLSKRIREAQKCLLSTGYPVPDSWLTVQAIGKLSSEYTAARKGKRETMVLLDSGADLQALEVVCREMGVAQLRLEAQLGSNVEPKTTSKQAPVEQGDVPITIAEFIAFHCVSDSRLTGARLDSLTKSLQSAARRKGSGVALPNYVGQWQPGRKKYYRPSQLRALWPSIVKHLPFLPPLKSSKP